jgi:hypothetical protein
MGAIPHYCRSRTSPALSHTNRTSKTRIPRLPQVVKIAPHSLYCKSISLTTQDHNQEWLSVGFFPTGIHNPLGMPIARSRLKIGSIGIKDHRYRHRRRIDRLYRCSCRDQGHRIPTLFGSVAVSSDFRPILSIFVGNGSDWLIVLIVNSFGARINKGRVKLNPGTKARLYLSHFLRFVLKKGC